MNLDLKVFMHFLPRSILQDCSVLQWRE